MSDEAVERGYTVVCSVLTVHNLRAEAIELRHMKAKKKLFKSICFHSYIVCLWFDTRTSSG